VIALGLALTLFAAGATGFAVIALASSSTAIALTAFGVTISASPLDLFFTGAVSVVVLGLGFALISRGTRRSARRHKEFRDLKQLRKDKAITATQAAADHKASSANDGAKDSTAGSTDKSTKTPRGRHATAEQHSSV
jgi:ABC-type nickel/cobalt efflux system permease component RcnA